MSSKIKKMRKDLLAKKNQREGMTFTSNEGCRFYIKEYNRYGDVTVKFLDEYGAEVHTSYYWCEHGQVKNPYFTSVYGTGCLGLMADGSKPVIKENGKLTRAYIVWRDMIRRCYSGEYPTYANVTVCERWLVYANFLEDLPKIENYQWWLENPNQRIALDKDIKQRGIIDKIYSLKTVKFVSDSENSEERWNKEIEEVKEDLVLGLIA